MSDFYILMAKNRRPNSVIFWTFFFQAELGDFCSRMSPHFEY